MDNWKEKLKNKPVRYWIRDEIEEIIKRNNIDRNRFSEYSKVKYNDIIKKFYYSFVDYEKHPYKDNETALNYCWLYFRYKLDKQLVCSFRGTDWKQQLQNIKIVVSDIITDRLYMILSEKWVYEGYIDEIVAVLSNTDYLLEDFYIVSPKYDWCIAYCSDGDCAVLYKK